MGIPLVIIGREVQFPPCPGLDRSNPVNAEEIVGFCQMQAKSRKFCGYQIHVGVDVKLVSILRNSFYGFSQDKI